MKTYSQMLEAGEVNTHDANGNEFWDVKERRLLDESIKALGRVGSGSGSIIYTKDDGSWVDDVNWAVTSRPFYSMPIIEREKIAIIPATYGPDSIIHGSWHGIIGYNSDNGEHLYECDAETPLFAAMRVYVASKLGWFPEVPNALV